MVDEVKEAPAPAQPAIGIVDLRNLLAIVELASRRGAFLPKEFGPIGETYNKVEAFLASTEPPAQAPEATAPEATNSSGG